MVIKLSKMTNVKTGAEKEKDENLKLFDVALKEREGSAPENYANCYCYGPVYPPCCK